MFLCHLFASMEKFEKEIFLYFLGVQTYTHTQCTLMTSFQLSFSLSRSRVHILPIAIIMIFLNNGSVVEGERVNRKHADIEKLLYEKLPLKIETQKRFLFRLDVEHSHSK